MSHSTTRRPLRARHFWMGAVLLIAGPACDAGSIDSQAGSGDWDAARRRMVDQQLGRATSVTRGSWTPCGRCRGIFSSRSRARSGLPRSPRAHRSRADDLPALHRRVHDAGAGVAPDHRVLEIGTGSGYQAAMLGRLAKEVYTIEIVPRSPIVRARRCRLRLRNVEVRTGNGYLGWPEHAPFDRIMVTAAPDEVPTALIEQLKIGGLMAIPVGTVCRSFGSCAAPRPGTETLAHASRAFRPHDRQAGEVGSIPFDPAP